MFVTIAVPAAERPARLARKARYALSSAVRIAATILTAPIRFYENRRLGEQLALMSDRDLSDIGLTRQDIVDTTVLTHEMDARTFVSQRRAAEWRHH